MAAPDDAVKTKLEAATAVGSSYGARIYLGEVLPVSRSERAAIFVMLGVSRGFTPMCGSAENRSDSTVQVRIRSKSGDYAGGIAVARAVRDRLHRASLTGYVGCFVRECEPTYIGRGEQDCHEWSLNVELLAFA